MRTRSFAAAAAATIIIGLVGAAAPASSAAPAAKRYANCTALNKHYPSGVGVPGARDRVRGNTKPVTYYTRNTAVYKANRGLDRDKDFIACEKR